MRFDLLFAYRRRFLMQFDPATRALSSTFKRPYSQHATQSSPRTQNASPPPPKRHRGAAVPSPFASKHFKLATRKPPRSSEPSPSPASPRQSSFNARRGSLKRSKMQHVIQPKTVLTGPYHTEAYIEKEYNKSSIPLRPYHKEAPRSPLNNFYQVITGKLPTFTSVDGVIIQGNQRIPIHR